MHHLAGEGRRYGDSGREGRLSPLTGHGDFRYVSSFVKEDGFYAYTAVELRILGRTVVKYVPLAFVFRHAAVIVPGVGITVDVVNDDASFLVRTEGRVGHGVGLSLIHI